MRETVRWNDLQLPVLGKWQVLVVGGGFPGICAATAAARAGANTLLTERIALLGGQAAEINTWGYDGFVDPQGHQLIRGLPWEVLQRTVREGLSDRAWSRVSPGDLERGGIAGAVKQLGYNPLLPYAGSCTMFNPFNDNFVSPNGYREAARKLLTEAGVRVLLEAPVIDTLTRDGKAVGVVLLIGNYRWAALAERIVDTSQNAAVCAFAGHPFPDPEVYMNSHIQCCGADIRRLIEYIRVTPEPWLVRPMDDKPASPDELLALADAGATLFLHGFRTAFEKAAAEDPEYELLRPDLPLQILYERDTVASPFVLGGRHVDLSDPFAYSDMILKVRRKQWLLFKFYRNYVPGFERLELADVCANVPKAHTAVMCAAGLTRYDLTEQDIIRGETGRDDTVAVVRGHPGCGQRESGWQIPMAALVAKSPENVVLTGKPVCRFIHYIATCAAVGQAAGVTAALSALTDTPLERLSAGSVQAELRSARQGFALK